MSIFEDKLLIKKNVTAVFISGRRTIYIYIYLNVCVCVLRQNERSFMCTVAYKDTIDESKSFFNICNKLNKSFEWHPISNKLFKFHSL